MFSTIKQSIWKTYTVEYIGIVGIIATLYVRKLKCFSFVAKQNGTNI